MTSPNSSSEEAGPDMDIDIFSFIPNPNSTEDHFLFLEASSLLPHPTLLSATAGMAAGILQGLLFTPVENTVGVLRRGTIGWVEGWRKVIGLETSSDSKLKGRSIISGVKGEKSVLQSIRRFLGIPHGIAAAWRGVRWGIARDGVSYAVFFAAFDGSRRTGLEVKKMMMWRDPLSDSKDTVAIGNGEASLTSAPTSARLAQATTLVFGGISASLLAEFTSRPFRKLESFSRRKEARAPGLEFSAHPNRGIVRPFNRTGGVINMTGRLIKEQGWKSLFRNPAGLSRPTEKGWQKVSGKMSRLGWRFAGVAPWGLGFLVFAYVGGEV